MTLKSETYAFSLSFRGSLLVWSFLLSVFTVESGPIDAFPPMEYRTPIELLEIPPAVD